MIAGYGLGAGIFFLGYCLCEIPGNLLLQRYGAKFWIARIMVRARADRLSGRLRAARRQGRLTW
jgi:hypothetical protein